MSFVILFILLEGGSVKMKTHGGFLKPMERTPPPALMERLKPLGLKSQDEGESLTCCDQTDDLLF